MQKVQVHTGGYTNVTFKAQPLGSIAGDVLFGPEMLPGLKGGVANAYVVAEPGEHAAIDLEDGSFMIDNLPAGDYAVSVDPKRCRRRWARSRKGWGSTWRRPTVGRADFTVGSFEKKVVFSFLGGGTAGTDRHTCSNRGCPERDHLGL